MLCATCHRDSPVVWFGPHLLIGSFVGHAAEGHP